MLELFLDFDISPNPCRRDKFRSISKAKGRESSGKSERTSGFCNRFPFLLRLVGWT